MDPEERRRRPADYVHGARPDFSANEIALPNVTTIDLLKEGPLPVPTVKQQRQKPKTWKNDWETFLIDNSPYAKHIAPLKEKHVPTPGEMAERKIKRLKDKLEIKDRDLLNPNQMGVEDDFDLRGWRGEMDALALALGPSRPDGPAPGFPLTDLRAAAAARRRPGEGGGAAASSSAAADGGIAEKVAQLEMPKYIHQEFADTEASWSKILENSAPIQEEESRRPRRRREAGGNSGGGGRGSALATAARGSQHPPRRGHRHQAPVAQSLLPSSSTDIS